VAVVPPSGVTPPFSIDVEPHVVASATGASAKMPMTIQPAIARAPTSHDRDLVRFGRAITDYRDDTVDSGLDRRTQTSMVDGTLVPVTYGA
jgi:hypothetical protein